MPGVAVVDSGNYDLQIATGFQVDAFVLDDALKGVLDNTEYVLDGTTEFADVMDSTVSVNVRRGRRDVGDQFSAGTMTFTIQDVDLFVTAQPMCLSQSFLVSLSIMTTTSRSAVLTASPCIALTSSTYSHKHS
jgi:hypothetical protein